MCSKIGQGVAGEELGCYLRKDVKQIDSGERTSFEFSEWRVTYTSFRAKLIIIYRPPYSQAHPVSPRVFFEEFSFYLESGILSSEPLKYYLMT